MNDTATEGVTNGHILMGNTAVRRLRSYRGQGSTPSRLLRGRRSQLSAAVHPTFDARRARRYMIGHINRPEVSMGDVSTSYDAPHHCSAVRISKNKTMSMDCPYTGKGDEFSPTNLVEAVLGGCMLLAMGAMAMRHQIDLSEARVETTMTSTDKPVMRFQSIDVHLAMPRGLSASQRTMLERAAEGCPIKHSFGDDIPLTVTYSCPD